MTTKSNKVFVTKLILFVFIWQVLQPHIFTWINLGKVFQASAKEVLETTELEILSQHNPELLLTHTEEKETKLEALQEEIDDQIETTWYGKAKSPEDKQKKKQLDALEDYQEDGYDALKDHEKEQIDALLALEEVAEFIEKDGEIKEVNPVLVKNVGTGGLTTAETEYEALIPEKGSEGVLLGIVQDEVLDGWDTASEDGQKTEEEEISVKFTQIGAADVPVKTTDNKALYEEIYPNVDLLLTTLATGVKEDLILKKPDSITNNELQITNEEAQIQSGHIGESDWVFNYEVDLSGLTMEESGSGLKFFDKAGNEVMFTPAPVMYDRLGRESYKAYFEIVTEEEALMGIKREKLEIGDDQVEETATGVVLTESGAIVIESGAVVNDELWIVNDEWEPETQSGSQVPLEGDTGGVDSGEANDNDENNDSIEAQDNDLTSSGETVLNEEEEEESEIDGNELNSYEDFIETLEKAEEIEQRESQGGWGGGWGGTASQADTEHEWTSESDESTSTGSVVSGTGELILDDELNSTDSNNNPLELETSTGSVETSTGAQVDEEDMDDQTLPESDEEQWTSTGDIVVGVEDEIPNSEESESESGDTEIDGNDLNSYEDFVEALEQAEEIEDAETESEDSESEGEEETPMEDFEEAQDEVVEEPEVVVEELQAPELESQPEPTSEPVVEEAPAPEPQPQPQPEPAPAPAAEPTAFWNKLFGIPLAVAESGETLSTDEELQITNEDLPATSYEPWASSSSAVTETGSVSLEGDTEGVEAPESEESVEFEDSNVDTETSTGETVTAESIPETQTGSEVIPTEEETEGVDSAEGLNVDENLEEEEPGVANGELWMLNAEWSIAEELPTTDYQLPTNSKVYIRLVADVSGLVYPIDLDPTIYINLYDKGNRTFAPDLSSWTQHGEYSQTNNPGRVNRGMESFLPQDGLVGYWDFDGDFIDESGNGNDGTAMSGATLTDDGKFGRAGSFYELNDYVQMGDVLDMGLSDLSIGVWVKSDSENNGMIVAKAYSVPYYYLKKTNNKIEANLHNGTNSISVTSTTDIVDSQWHYVFASFDRDGELKIYIDAELEASVDISGSELIDILNTNSLSFGANCNLDCDLTGNYFDGLIDDVTIYNRPLSADEISQIYAGGRTNAVNPQLTLLDSDGTENVASDTASTSQDWSAVSDSLRTNQPWTKIEFTTSLATEIWAGLTYSPAGGIVKATVDKGTDFEVVNYIDTYADEVQAEQKTLIATGLRNEVHTLELELTGKKNLKQADPTYSTTETEPETHVEDVFSTYLYEGNGSTQTIENGIDLENNDGLVWVKRRDAGTNGNNSLYDTERWPLLRLVSDLTNGNINNANTLTSFNSNGFSLWNYADTNNLGSDIASWTFREAPGFFDIVTYTGDGTTDNLISHSLGTEPGMIIVKRTDTTGDWVVYHRTQSNVGFLNYTNSFASAQRFSSVTNNAFTIGVTTADVNAGGGTYVAYLFANDESEDGKIQCGSETALSNTVPLDIDLGWEPQWVLWKDASSTTGYWWIQDVMRGFNAKFGNLQALWPHLSNAESSYSTYGGLTSQWFSIQSNHVASGHEYIYCAIRTPQKEPVNSSEVFAIDRGNGTTPAFESWFPVDFAFESEPGAMSNRRSSSRLTGEKALMLESTVAESSYANAGYDNMTKWNEVASWSSDWQAWMFKRAPGFFDVVAYESTGVVGEEFNHNLGAEPELMMIKNRDSGAFGWQVFAKSLGNTKGLLFNSNAGATMVNYWNSTTPTDTVFTLHGQDEVNGFIQQSYISYLFATVPDVSKVGAYTGTAADLDIDAGFTNGAKFVLIKRTDATGDWYMWDAERGIVAGNDPYILLNSTAAEVTSTDYIDPLDAGFTLTSSAPAALNASGGEYIYLAIANPNGETQPTSSGTSETLPEQARLSVDYFETYAPGHELQTQSTVGTADGGSSVTLNDTDTALTQTGTNAYKGYALTLTSGEHNGKTVYVATSLYSLGTVTLTFAPELDSAIASGTTYQLTNDGIFINSRATRGIYNYEWQITNYEFGIEGNIPTDSEGKASKGTFSIWVKPDFAYNADTNNHYIFDTGLQRLYYNGSDDKWHFEVYNGTDWTTVKISSEGQSFNAQETIYLSVSWDASTGFKLFVNDQKNTQSVTWTAQALSANTSSGIVVIGSDATQNNNFNGTLAEPQIFDYFLTDSEIDDIFTSEVPSVGQAHTQKIEIETNSQLSTLNSKLLFNAPMVNTPNDRIGTLAGGARLTTATWGTVFVLTGSVVTYTTPDATTEIIAGFDTGTGAGIAKVTIDGGTSREIVTEIDTYSGSAATDQRFLIATGLDSDVHTVKIEATGLQNLNSSGAVVTPKFIETDSQSSVASKHMSVNGRFIDDVITQDYTTLPNAIQFPDKGNLAEAEHEGSFELWLSGSVASGDSFVDTRDSSGKNGLALHMSGATALAFSYYNGTGSISVTDSDFASSYNASNANHLLAKWWSSSETELWMSLYLNGQKIAENKAQEFVPSNHSQIILGNDSTPDSSADFDGEIYDFAIHSWSFDDGGVAVDALVWTGSSVFNAYKSIATKLEKIEEVTASGSVINAIDNSNTTFYLERGVLLNSSGATATENDLKVYVNWLETSISSVEAGTYARINQTDGISALADSLTIDSIVDSSEIPSSGFLYFGNPSGQLKREKVYYANYSAGTFSWLVRGVETNCNLSLPGKWADNTIVEIVGAVTLNSVPAENADVFMEYRYSGDAVERSRDKLQFVSTNVEFLEQTEDYATGWALDKTTEWASGSGKMVTDLIGQTGFMQLRGTEISVVLSESISSGSTALFVIDEGTASEKNVIVDLGDSNELQKIKSLYTNLSDDLHTLRLVNLENKTLAMDAMTANGHAPILKPSASSEIIYETPVADLNPETSGENQINDVFYWNTLEWEVESGEAGEKRTNLISNLNETQLAMLVEDVEGMPDSGVVQIADEQIKYNAKASDGTLDKLLNLERGYNGTTATNHTIASSQEIIAGLSNVRDVFVYDTNKDTIDNAWRFDRTKSWYTEASSVTRCPNGYQDAGSQKCTRAFPEVAVIVGTYDRLYIYDSESKELWMQFNVGVSHKGWAWVKSVFAMNWVLWGASNIENDSEKGDLLKKDFLNDETWTYDVNSRHQTNVSDTIADRNLPWTDFDNIQSNYALVNRNVNDVHAAVIDNKTYVAVATDAGVSVINETDGAVVDLAVGETVDSCQIADDSLYCLDSTEQNIKVWYKINEITVDDTSADFVYSATSTPAINLQTTNYRLQTMTNTSPFGGNTIYIGTDAGVTIIQEKQGDESNGSVKYITSEYETEEMVGDVRGMWSFDGANSLGDNSIKTNNLTNNGGVDFSEDGVRGKAASFDGTNYLSVADNSETEPTGNFSVGAWVKTDSSCEDTYCTILNKSNWISSIENDGYILRSANNNKWQFIIHNNDSVGALLWITSPKRNEWQFVVGVFDTENDILRLYVDGKQESERAYTSAMGASSADLLIGSASASMAWAMNGSIDEPFITAEALDASTIKRMYDTGRAALDSTYEQKLAGTSNAVQSISVSGDTLYVATGSGTDAGLISKINLNSGSREETIDTNSTFAGGTIWTLDTIQAISAWNAGLYFADGNEVYADFAEVKTVANFTTDNQGDWRTNQTASWYQVAGAMPEELKIVAMDTGLGLIDNETNAMWMRFGKGVNRLFGESLYSLPSSVVAWDGVVWTGLSGTGSTGLLKIDYLHDTVEKYDSNGHYVDLDYTLDMWNESEPSWSTGSGESIIGNSINALDLTTRYLAIATGSGVSVLDYILNTTTNSTETDSTAAVEFDDTGSLYYAQGTNIYLSNWLDTNFTAEDSLDIGSNINAIALNNDSVYIATNDGVKKIIKSNFSSGAILSINSGNTDSSTDIATDVEILDDKLVITFSSGVQGESSVVVWNTVEDIQHDVIDVDDDQTEAPSVVVDGEDFIIANDQGLLVVNNPAPGEEGFNTIEIVSGNNQLGEMLNPVSLPLKVRVSDGYGYYAGSGDVVVDFSVTSQPNAIGTGATLSASSVSTDTSGYAQVNLTLGDRAGDYEITANFSGAVASQIFTVREKEKFELKISGDKEHIFELDPDGVDALERSNTITLTHNAASFDFKAIVEHFPTDGVNTLNDWDGNTGFGWVDGETTAAFGTGATVYSATGASVNLEHAIKFKMKIDYDSPVSEGFDGQVTWDVENLVF